MTAASSLASFVSTRIDLSLLNAKEKRYSQQVEKVIDSFDSIEEWADYIAFLSKLQKSLQLNEANNSVTWIPDAAQIASKLSFCLSSQLPSGVHQKALTLYELIFSQLSDSTFNRQLHIWLPGLFPIFSYAALSIKPLLINIYQLIMDKTFDLKIICQPFIISLLPGLEVENSEVFQDVMDLLDNFRLKLNDDSTMWQNIFIIIIGNSEKRLGALRLCSKYLPVMKDLKNLSLTSDSIKNDIGPSNNCDLFPSDIKSCLYPEPGLIVRAFAVSIAGNNDIVVVRGYFDLLLSHLPISSSIFMNAISPKDKKLLIMSCVKITLLKDMSLNRRVWNYLLGPEIEESNRSKYFETNALDELYSGLIKMTKGNLREKIDVYKISVSLILDKWEISNLITSKLFSPLLYCCYENKENSDLIISAQAFFDAIEPTYIWHNINLMIGSDESLELVHFILKNFNFNDEEMILTHVPLNILALLLHKINLKKINILKIMIEMLPPLTNDTEEKISLSSDDISSAILKFYESKINESSPCPPFTFGQLSELLVQNAKRLYITHCKDSFATATSTIFCSILERSPNIAWDTHDLVQAILDIPICEDNITTALATTKVLNYLDFPTFHEKQMVLKIVLSNLWFSLVSNNPSNYQVEVVKAIYDLQAIYSPDELEAGLFELLSKETILKRVKSFGTIWIHSSLISDGDMILMRPLQLLLDELNGKNSGVVSAFIRNTIKSGFANRLIKLITNPLLKFEFFNVERLELMPIDDLSQFAYFMRSISDVMNSNPKLLKEAINNELPVIDSSSKIGILESNGWNVSSYKSLMLALMEKFFDLKVPDSLLKDNFMCEEWYHSVCASIDVLNSLITGNESDFSGRLNHLIKFCMYFVEKPYNSEIIELTQEKILNCILHFLDISENSNMKLNLFYIQGEGNQTAFLKLLIKGIQKVETSVLLERWLHVITKCLHLFSESIFTVLLALNDALVHKLDLYFTQIADGMQMNERTDVETSMNYLMSGLEDLLCISHSYLLTSSLQAYTKNNNGNDGFFGNVIQGVFQIESPAIRSSEQNKLYSILISFQDAVKVCFHIWQWADSKPQLSSVDVSDRSLAYIASKLKFRAKKLLETLLDLEKKEVIETFVEIDPPQKTSIKLLNILDGGRSQVTLPHIFDSISSRCYPQLLEESKRSSLNTNISEKDLSRFLVSYFYSVDADTVLEIFNITIQFLKTVLANITSFRVIIPDCLMISKLLFLKLDSSKYAEQKRSKRDLSDILVKLFSAMMSKGASSGSPDLTIVDGDNVQEGSNLDNALILQDEVLRSLSFVLSDLELILSDQDKVTSTVNIVVSNLIVPQTKGKRLNDISLQALSLLEMVGAQFPTKMWKLLVNDLFMNNSLFEQNTTRINNWDKIFSIWISGEKGKVGDMISRITPAPSVSTSNLFVWNEGSEIDIKINTIKRLAYIILIQPDDYFVPILQDLFDRIKFSVSGSCPAKYKSEVTVLLRVITLKFSDLQLLPYWTFISYQLVTIFEIILTKPNKDLSTLLVDEAVLILYGCKLLDQLLLLGFDEFNLHEWIYVKNSPDIIDGTLKSKMVSIIDQIAMKYDLNFFKDTPLRPEQPHENMKPILYGVKHINHITKLRLFFDSLSLINYERMFSLFKVDRDSLLADALNDILV